jgi:hypothetical protein
VIKIPRRFKTSRAQQFAYGAAQAIKQSCIDSKPITQRNGFGKPLKIGDELVYNEELAFRIIEGAIRYGRPTLIERFLLFVAGKGETTQIPEAKPPELKV